jgi:CRP/FNR family transcriptional regulator, cyclic AMP receptor protein
MNFQAIYDPAALLAQFAESTATPWGLAALVAGGVAGVLIVISCFVKTILPLRLLAVGSNAGFMVFGLLHPSLPTFLLHATLLPLNLFRATQMMKLTRRVKVAAASGERTDVWFKPYMRPKRLRAGTTLFRKGDLADRLYYLVEGRIDLVERGRTLQPGRLFGEIAFFAPDRRRTATARCVTACTVLSIDGSTFRQLYYQNPDFGFEVVSLIAGRLTEDVQQLERQLAQGRPPPAGD